MKKTIIIVSVLWVLLFSVSCDKYGNRTRSESITFGDDSEMHIQVINLTLEGTKLGKYDNIEIDADEDGEDDLRFVANVWGSAGQGINEWIRLKNLNSKVAIFGSYLNDTVFNYKDTSIYDNGAKYFQDNYVYNSCLRNSAEDSIVSINTNVYYLKPNTAGSSMNATNTFSLDSVLIAKSDYKPAPFQYQYSGDTIYNDRYIEKYNCQLFSLNEELYIGFQIESDKSSKLGWVKVKLYSESKIEIIECAIQK